MSNYNKFNSTANTTSTYYLIVIVLPFKFYYSKHCKRLRTAQLSQLINKQVMSHNM